MLETILGKQPKEKVSLMGRTLVRSRNREKISLAEVEQERQETVSRRKAEAILRVMGDWNCRVTFHFFLNVR